MTATATANANARRLNIWVVPQHSGMDVDQTPYAYSAMAEFILCNQRVVGDVHQISTENTQVTKLIRELVKIGEESQSRPTILNADSWESDGYFAVPAELALGLITELTTAGKFFDAKYGSQQ